MSFWHRKNLLLLSQHLLSGPSKEALSLHQVLHVGRINRAPASLLWQQVALCQHCREETCPALSLSRFQKYWNSCLFHYLHWKVSSWECVSHLLLALCLAGIWWFHLHFLCNGNGVKDGGPGDLWQEVLPWRYLEPPGFLHCHGWVGWYFVFACSLCWNDFWNWEVLPIWKQIKVFGNCPCFSPSVPSQVKPLKSWCFHQVKVNSCKAGECYFWFAMMQLIKKSFQSASTMVKLQNLNEAPREETVD